MHIDGAREQFHPRRFIATVAGCQAMAAVSIDMLLPAFKDIRADLGLAADSTKVSWVITAFFLGLASGQLVYGPLSDRFGRKPLLNAGLAVFLVGAVATAFAPSLGLIVAGRFVWGLGAAAPRSLALAMVRDRFEGEQMARTMSLVMATFLLVPVFAPAVGALVLALGPWRSIVWVQFSAALVLAFVITRLPETLPPERRRAVGPGALVSAARIVVRSRPTVAYGLAVTCFFSIMTSYVGSAELIVRDVFGHGDLFPLVFGVLAVGLALGSLLSARLVMRFGLARLLRGGAAFSVGAAALLAAVSFTRGGRPPFVLFCVLLAPVLSSVMLLVPNANTAAMQPVPHVAGMAAALLGTVSTAGGALLGAMLDGAFDGTVRPFAVGLLAFALGGTGFVVLARRAQAGAVAPVAPVAVGE